MALLQFSESGDWSLQDELPQTLPAVINCGPPEKPKVKEFGLVLDPRICP